MTAPRGVEFDEPHVLGVRPGELVLPEVGHRAVLTVEVILGLLLFLLLLLPWAPASAAAAAGEASSSSHPSERVVAASEHLVEDVEGIPPAAAAHAAAAAVELERELASAAAAAGEAAGEAASHAAERVRARILPRLGLSHAVLAVVVVDLALLRVREDVVGLGDLGELVHVAALVRVVLQRELPVHLLDRPVVRAAVDVQHLVQILTRLDALDGAAREHRDEEKNAGHRPRYAEHHRTASIEPPARVRVLRRRVQIDEREEES